MAEKTIYGILSDTHGSLAAGVLEAFDGVRRIYHCGDVGAQRVVTELETVAPTRAVSGNMDPWALAAIYPEQVVEGAEFGVVCMAHGTRYGHDNEAIISGLAGQFRNEKPRLVLFGHTHKPVGAERDGILFLNPGSASLPRRGQPPSVALLEYDADSRDLSVRIVPIHH